MTLAELLDNPDYTEANTATKRAIFEKYSKDDENYTGANSATKAAIREKFGLGGVNVRDTARLPEKVTDFSLGDWGNLVKQSITEATDIINQGQRKPIVGPAVMAGVGELIKGAGAVGELATDRAQPITQAGQFITESAKEVNPVAGTVGQVGSYVAPYSLAAKGIRAVAPTVGTIGEMTGSGAIVGGLTTPGSAEERLQEAALQAALGGGTVLALKGAGAAYQGAKNMGRGAMEGIENPIWAPGANTAFADLGKTYYPTSAVKPWQAMTPAERVAGLPALEATQESTARLFKTPTQKIARAFAEPSPSGGILVPHQGQVLQAFGEQTARDLINKPLQTAAANLAGPVLGGLVGGPVGALAGLAASPKMWKALDLIKLGKLSQTAALQPGFTQQIAQARATSALTPSSVPRLTYTPPGGGGGAPGPISPQAMAAQRITPATNPAQAAAQATVTGPVAPNMGNLLNNIQTTMPGIDPATARNIAVQTRAAEIIKQAKQNGFKVDKNTANTTAVNEMRTHEREMKAAYDASPEGQAKIAAEQAQAAESARVQAEAMRAAQEAAAAQRAQSMTSAFANVDQAAVDKMLAGTRTRGAGAAQEAINQAATTKKFEKVAGPVEPTPIVETPTTRSVTTESGATFNLRKSINDAAKYNVQSAGNKLKIDTKGYDEAVRPFGVKLDWSQAPDISEMGVKEGRKTIAQWANKEASSQMGAEAKQTRGPRYTATADDVLKAEAEIARRKSAFGSNYKPPSRFEMMTAEPQTTFKNKEAYIEQRFNDKLAGEPTVGSYIDNGKLYEYELNLDYAGAPPALKKHMGPQVRERVTDLATGKIIKGEAPSLTLREKLEAAKKKGK